MRNGPARISPSIVPFHGSRAFSFKRRTGTRRSQLDGTQRPDRFPGGARGANGGRVDLAVAIGTGPVVEGEQDLRRPEPHPRERHNHRHQGRLRHSAGGAGEMSDGDGHHQHRRGRGQIGGDRTARPAGAVRVEARGRDGGESHQRRRRTRLVLFIGQSPPGAGGAGRTVRRRGAGGGALEGIVRAAGARVRRGGARRIHAAGAHHRQTGYRRGAGRGHGDHVRGALRGARCLDPDVDGPRSGWRSRSGWERCPRSSPGCRVSPTRTSTTWRSSCPG